MQLKSSTGNSSKRLILLEQSKLVSEIINFFENTKPLDPYLWIAK